MNVRVHIERLVLEGIPLAARDRAAIRRAVERELASLLHRRGRAWQPTSVAVAHVPGPPLTVRDGATAGGLGGTIARSVDGAIGRAVAG